MDKDPIAPQEIVAQNLSLLTYKLTNDPANQVNVEGGALEDIVSSIISNLENLSDEEFAAVADRLRALNYPEMLSGDFVSAFLKIGISIGTIQSIRILARMSSIV